MKSAFNNLPEKEFPAPAQGGVAIQRPCGRPKPIIQLVLTGASPPWLKSTGAVRRLKSDAQIVAPGIRLLTFPVPADPQRDSPNSLLFGLF